MRLTVVGCSGSAPGPDSGGSCYLVESGDVRLVLDLGSGSVGTLQRFVDPTRIDTVVVSHAHSDHFGDLDHFGYLRERAGVKPVKLIGTAGLPSYVWENPDVYEASLPTAEPFAVGPMTVRLAPVDHGDCWATRVSSAAHGSARPAALCYTADSAPCAALDELAAGCRVLLAEASGLDADGPVPRHLTAGDAARLAVRSGAELLVLTHLRPWLDPVALLEEAATIAPGPVVLATTGLRVAL